MCITGWKYTDGKEWKDEPTIRLKCKNKFKSKHSTFVDQVEFEEKDVTDLGATRSSLGQVPQEEACKEFFLSSVEGARLYQQSRFGTYKLQNVLVNGRVTYFNEEKSQYLFWINKYDQYWMVSEY